MATSSTTTPTGWDRGLIGRLVGPIFEGSTWSATGFLVSSLFVGAWWFAAAVALLAIGVSTLIIVVGVPILVALGSALRAMATSERGRLRAAGVAIVEPAGDNRVKVDNTWAGLQAELRDPGTARRLLYALLLLPVGVMTFSAAAVTWLVPLSFVATPFLVAVGFEPTASSAAGGWEIAIDTPTEANTIAVVGLLLLPVAPRIIRAVIGWHAGLIRGLLDSAVPVSAPSAPPGVEVIR